MRKLNSLITLIALSFAPAMVGCATSGDEDVVADDESSATAPGSVDLWQDTSSQWHFHVVAGNKNILLTSESYTSRTGAINGLLSVLDNGVDPLQYTINQVANGWNLHLRAGNFETVAFTQSYSTKSNAKRAITSCVKAITTYLDKAAANTTGARVEVGAGTTGKFHFNMFAQNGQIILSSESYTTEAAAWNGAFAVQAAATAATSFAIKTATDGRFYFTVTADNGQVIGVSQLYTTKAAAQNGITSVQSLLRGLDIL
jgi:uncharacterized protein YegP (UPF0339 family)